MAKLTKKETSSLYLSVDSSLGGWMEKACLLLPCYLEHASPFFFLLDGHWNPVCSQHPSDVGECPIQMSVSPPSSLFGGKQLQDAELVYSKIQTYIV